MLMRRSRSRRARVTLARAGGGGAVRCAGADLARRRNKSLSRIEGDEGHARRHLIDMDAHRNALGEAHRGECRIRRNRELARWLCAQNLPASAYRKSYCPAKGTRPLA